MMRLRWAVVAATLFSYVWHYSMCVTAKERLLTCKIFNSGCTASQEKNEWRINEMNDILLINI